MLTRARSPHQAQLPVNRTLSEFPCRHPGAARGGRSISHEPAPRATLCKTLGASGVVLGAPRCSTVWLRPGSARFAPARVSYSPATPARPKPAHMHPTLFGTPSRSPREQRVTRVAAAHGMEERVLPKARAGESPGSSVDSECSTLVPEGIEEESSLSTESDESDPRAQGSGAPPLRRSATLPGSSTEHAAHRQSLSGSAAGLHRPGAVQAKSLLASCAAPTTPSPTSVMLFDWDDTLLPTSFLDSLPAAAIDATCSANYPTLNAMRLHAKLIVEVLRAARAVARISIVTLSKRPWVMQSAERFLPGVDFPALVQELGITTYYAGEHASAGHEAPPSCVVDYRILKRNAMARSLTDWYETGLLGVARLNVLSIGDSFVEQQALKELLWAWEDSGLIAESPICKTLKLMERPTLRQLGEELRQLPAWLPRSACVPRSFDVAITSPAEFSQQVIAAGA